MSVTHTESQPNIEQEHPEVINPGLIVERRTVGNITYVVALCKHVGEFADAIKDALSDCDYLAIEQPGHNYGEERRDKDVARQTDEKMGGAIKDLASAPKTQAFYIDMHQDDPNMKAIKKLKAAHDIYTLKLVNFEPPSTLSTDLDYAAYCTAETDEVRDSTIDNQLTVQVPAHIREGTVGVLLGMTHYRALKNLGDTPPDPSLLAAKVKPLLDGFAGLVEVYKEGQRPSADTIGRRLVHDYFMVSDIPSEKIDTITNELQPDVVDRILNEVQRRTIGVDDPEIRRKNCVPFLLATFESLEHQAKLKLASAQSGLN